MNAYKKNTEIVLEYLSGSGVCQSVIDMSHSCFKKLGKYLSSYEICFSIGEAEKWLSVLTLSDDSIRMYHKAIRQLDDVFRYGHVSFSNHTHLVLMDSFNAVVTDYLTDVSHLYSSSHLENIYRRCRFFFGFVQIDRRIDNPEGIRYEDILSFHRDALPSLSKADQSQYKGTSAGLLLWMAEKNLCPLGFSMLLVMNHAEKAVMLDDLSISVAGKIKKIGEESVKDFPPVEFREASSDFIGDLKNHRYAATMLNTARLTLDMLFLFLDMNQLGYDPEIATIWYEEVGEECFKKNRLMSRRVLSLFAEFTVGGAVHPEKFFVYRKTLCEELPDWYKEAINPFLDQKRREKKAASTVCMYRSAATRFCTHLTAEGITSFDQINAEVLKRFNLTDHHETAEGKNAYNVRIRKFLLFLFENGYTTNPFLGESLPCTSAPKTRVVGVLTDQETHKLENYSEDDMALGLRNRAIALLGLKMGLRGSDITSLRFSQINWDQQSIRFCQEKTDIGKNLPMPTEVGNAIYRYVTEGRPQSRSDYIFITHKAPYIKIGRSVCGKIIKKAFPDKQGTGFHITRKTFATNRFRNNCGYRDVAYLLGHSNTETVHKYISLDEERMRMCPISLCEAGILMEGGFRDE